MLKHYKDLTVWQKSYDLCLEIYRITAKFPKEKRYGLTAQIRKSVYSFKYSPRIWQEDNHQLHSDALHIF
ncbi:MAG: four helix bundle protein [Desulfobacterales bacterium]|nr:four helix bundle protein [Deltaproteobacteria bacterium]NNL78363.1 four helix bundle protein [Desulfobacterales bacterium]